MKLSACIIAKDEGAVLERCLNCVKQIADEIVFVDTGSVDNTVEIAKKFTDNIYFFKWINDFSAARNYSFSKATGDHVIWIDCDDVITDENIRKINALKEKLNAYDAVFFKYAIKVNGETVTEFYRERILRRDKNFKWSGAVHEAISVSGKIFYSDAVIFHEKVKENEPMRNLKIYLGLINSGKKLSLRDTHYYGRELYFNRIYLESAAVLSSFISSSASAFDRAAACLTAHYALTAADLPERGAEYLLKSLTLAPPSSEVCCALGEYFFNLGRLGCAEFWYNNALESKNNFGFVNRDFLKFVPYIMLCAICDKKGDMRRAFGYNHLAGREKTDENYLKNREYLINKLRIE